MLGRRDRGRGEQCRECGPLVGRECGEFGEQAGEIGGRTGGRGGGFVGGFGAVARIA